MKRSATEQGAAQFSIRSTLRVFVGAAVVISPPMFRENGRQGSIYLSALFCATWVIKLFEPIDGELEQLRLCAHVLPSESEAVVHETTLASRNDRVAVDKVAGRDEPGTSEGSRG